MHAERHDDAPAEETQHGEPTTGVHKKVDRDELVALVGRPVTLDDIETRAEGTASACALCEGPLGARPRRACCQTCWRKWRAAGLELPPPSRPGPRAGDPLLMALDRLSPAQRLKALVHLATLDGSEAPGPEDTDP